MFSLSLSVFTRLDLCRRTLAENDNAVAGAGSDSEGEDDHLDKELAPIRTQLALALQLQGRTDEARVLYQQVVKLKCAHHSPSNMNNSVIMNFSSQLRTSAISIIL